MGWVNPSRAPRVICYCWWYQWCNSMNSLTAWIASIIACFNGLEILKSNTDKCHLLVSSSDSVNLRVSEYDIKIVNMRNY